MNERLRRLYAERATVWARMTEIRDRAADHTELSAEDRQSWDQAEQRLAELTGDIDREVRAVALAGDMERVDRSLVPAGTDTPAEDTEADYRTAFDLWARFGNEELDADQRSVLRRGASQIPASELRAAGVGTGAAGGFLVPAQFRNTLVETLRFFSGVRQVAEVITTDNGASLPWPTNNDTANVGAILAENTQVTEQDVTFGTASLDVYMYTSKLVRVALQLIQDSAVDIEDFLPRKLGERIGRIQNQHFTTGTGTAQPQGLVTGATATQAPTGNTTTIPYDTLIDLTAAIDPAYLNGGNLRWMLSQAALGAVRKLKDTTGQPLWQPSLQAGEPDTLLGYGIVLNNDMPAPAANAKSVLFGDFRRAYVVRDATGVQAMRLNERYADFLQVGFLSFQRSGGMVQDASAVRAFQHSAT